MAEVTWTPGELDRNSKFYVAGHNGMVGSAIWRHLEASGFTNLIGKRSSELDLRNRDAVGSSSSLVSLGIGARIKTMQRALSMQQKLK